MKTLYFIILILLAGLYEVQSQPCSFTSFRNAFYLQGDTIRILHQINTDDGGQLWVGKTNKVGSPLSDGLIVKFDAALNIIWSKRISSTQPLSSLTLNNSIVSTTGDYIIAGYSSRQSGNKEFSYYLLRCDPSGNISWQQEYPISSIVGQWNDIALTDLAEDNTVLYVAGTLNGDIPQQSNGQFSLLFKTDLNGNLIFSKLFHHSSVPLNNLIGIYPHNGNLLLWGFGEDDNNTQTDTRRVYWMQISSNDASFQSGQAFCFKPFGLPAISYSLYPYFFKSFKTNNGFAITGLLAESAATKRALATFHFDSDLQISNSWALPQITGVISANSGDFSIVSDGRLLLAQRSTTENDKTFLTSYGVNGNIIKQRKVGNFGTSTGVNVLNGGIRIGVSNDNVRFVSNYINNGSPVAELLDLSLGSNDSICFGKQTQFGSAQPFETYVMPATQFDLIDNIVSTESAAFNSLSVAIQSESICSSQFICSQLNLIGLDTVCVLGQPVTYTVRRNQECSASVKWIFDSANCVNATWLSDSSISIQWRNTAAGLQTTKLIATFDNCNTVSDTLSVVLVPFIKPFQPDTSLCKGDSIKLTPGNWFKRYKWQDGSEDSVFIAKKPGFYKVVYETFCNRTFTDSVTINPLEIELFPNKLQQICKGDSINLQAKSGFADYQWSPDYHIKSIAANEAIVNPPIDTAYFVSALIKPGCRIFDTIRIQAIVPGDIQIKQEQKSCEETILIVQSSSTLSEIVWSGQANGTTSQIKAEKSGWYFIAARDNAGCRVKDSINIEVLPCLNTISFPNAFTPNRDGLNDVFRPIVKGQLLNYELSIYNRWGQKVFSSQNPSSGWNGTISGKLQQQQNFVWICSYQFFGGQIISKKGMVVLIK